MRRREPTRKGFVFEIVLALVAVVFAGVPRTLSAEEDYPDGMVSYWMFDEGSGNTVDDHVSGYDGTISGASWTDGLVESALRFNGLNNRIEIPNGVAQSTRQNVTVEAWIKPEGTSGVYDVIFARGSDIATPGGDWGAVLFLRRDNRPCFAIVINQRGYEIRSTTTIELGEWHHVVGVRRGTTFEIWVNGKLTSGSCPNGDLRGSNISYVGYHYWPGQNTHFGGCIDEVGVWNKALSTDEIEDHRIRGLLGYGYCCYVVPKDAVQNSISVVATLNLPKGIENSLTSKLENAVVALEKENYDAAVNKIEAFINQVEAQRGKTLSVAEANNLIVIADWIIHNIWAYAI